MPIYEYRCRKCSAITEALVKNHKTKPALVCKKCGGKNFMKEISSPGILKNSSNGCDMNPSCGSASCCGGMCKHG